MFGAGRPCMAWMLTIIVAICIARLDGANYADPTAPGPLCGSDLQPGLTRATGLWSRGASQEATPLLSARLLTTPCVALRVSPS